MQVLEVLSPSRVNFVRKLVNTPKIPKILITELQCIVNDEVYLKYKGKKVWTKSKRYTSMDNGEKFSVEIEISHNQPDPTTGHIALGFRLFKS